MPAGSGITIIPPGLPFLAPAGTDARSTSRSLASAAARSASVVPRVSMMDELGVCQDVQYRLTRRAGELAP